MVRRPVAAEGEAALQWGSPRPAPSTGPGSRASTGWCTWPEPASATPVGPTTLASDWSPRSRTLRHRAAGHHPGRARRLASPESSVSGSAIGYYGDRGDEVLSEASGPGHDFLARLCVAWEAASAPASDANIRVAAIRTGVVLTRRGGALPKLLPLFKLGLGGRYGSGRQWWSWTSGRPRTRSRPSVWLLDEACVAGPGQRHRPPPGHQRRVTSPRRWATPCTARQWCRCQRSVLRWWSGGTWPTPCCSPPPGCSPRPSRPAANLVPVP